MLRQLINNTGRVSKNVAPLLVTTRSSVVAATQQEWDTARPFEDIPGPKPLPLIGNVVRFLPGIGDLSLDLLELQLSLYNKHGTIYKIVGIPGKHNMVFLHTPEDIEKVMRNEGPWPERPTVESLQYYRTKSRKDLFEGVGGALVTQGEEWQAFRSKVNPILMQPRSTKLYVEPIDAVASDFIKRVRYIRDEKLEMPDNFNNELYRWALESIVYIALDTRMGCLNNELKPDSEPQQMIDAVQVLFRTMYYLDMKVQYWKLLSTPKWRSFVKASDFFSSVCVKYINQAMERLKALPEDTDRELTVLEKLLARDSNPKTAVVMALDMFFAGIDTTSYSSAVALYFLAKNPDKQEKLFQEISSHLPDKQQPVTTEILNELKYLKACIKESMRLRPIVIVNGRTLFKDLVLSGYRVPKGTDVILSHMHLCSMEKYFSKPDQFIPERWLKGSATELEGKSQHPFVFMPFGFGPRMCLGKRFAELEMETLLSKLIRNFRVEYNYGDMVFESKLLYTPSSPLKFKFVDRE